MGTNIYHNPGEAPYITDVSFSKDDAVAEDTSSLAPNQPAPFETPRQYEERLSDDVATQGTVANMVYNVGNEMDEVEGLFRAGREAEGIRLAKEIVEAGVRYRRNISYLAGLRTYVPSIGPDGQELASRASAFLKGDYLNRTVSYLGQDVPLGQIIRNEGLVKDARKNELVNRFGVDSDVASVYVDGGDKDLTHTLDVVMKPLFQARPEQQAAGGMFGTSAFPEVRARAKAYASAVTSLWEGDGQEFAGMKKTFGDGSSVLMETISNINQTTMTGPEVLRSLVTLANNSSSLKSRTPYERARLVGNWYRTVMETSFRGTSVEKGILPRSVMDTEDATDGKRILNFIISGLSSEKGKDGAPAVDLDFSDPLAQQAIVKTLDMYQDLKDNGVDLFDISSEVRRPDLVRGLSSYAVAVMKEDRFNAGKKDAEGNPVKTLLRPVVNSELSSAAAYNDDLNRRFVGDMATYAPYDRSPSGSASERAGNMKFASRGGSASTTLDAMAKAVRGVYAKSFISASFSDGTKTPWDIERGQILDKDGYLTDLGQTFVGRVSKSLRPFFSSLGKGDEIASLVANYLVTASSENGGKPVGVDEAIKALATSDEESPLLATVDGDGRALSEDAVARNMETLGELQRWMAANVQATSLFRQEYVKLKNHYMAMYGDKESLAASKAMSAMVSCQSVIDNSPGGYDATTRAKVEKFVDSALSYAPAYVKAVPADEKGHVSGAATYFYIPNMSLYETDQAGNKVPREFFRQEDRVYKLLDFNPEDVAGEALRQKANYSAYHRMILEETERRKIDYKAKHGGKPSTFAIP